MVLHWNNLKIERLCKEECLKNFAWACIYNEKIFGIMGSKTVGGWSGYKRF